MMVDDDEHGVIEVGALFDREGRFYCCRYATIWARFSPFGGLLSSVSTCA